MKLINHIFKCKHRIIKWLLTKAKIIHVKIITILLLGLISTTAFAVDCQPGSNNSIANAQITQLQIDAYNKRVWFHYKDNKPNSNEVLVKVYEGNDYTVQSVVSLLNNSLFLHQTIELCLNKNNDSTIYLHSVNSALKQ
ncbi:hypothetical protein [Providencia burhodogranariea]|uniref:Uncharacterized protein n=1 Tax=Providencia burhodogranariea DSM 19968 TaxID=1141662 RepID=K8WPA3_9GAMM|nr:hypothetical protein [Providencia burhodogranariea]EKT62438.1 hypothetical protein OOA_07620 [Providencia burhodogranariea DSM 19968]